MLIVMPVPGASAERRDCLQAAASREGGGSGEERAASAVHVFSLGSVDSGACEPCARAGFIRTLIESSESAISIASSQRSSGIRASRCLST